MARESFIPRTDADKTTWLNNFANKIGAYLTKYGLTPAERTDVQNTAADWDYRMGVVQQMSTYKEALVKWKNYLRDGAPAGTVVTMPALPTLGTAPTAAAPGGFARAASLAKRIKAHAAYSEADGRDLGIDGDTADRPDLSSIKPVITTMTGNMGHPKFGWKLNDMGGLNVYKDEGTGFRFYARDNHPDYEDTAPLPANPTRWKYKFAYVLGDEEVGQFSDIVTVTVG